MLESFKKYYSARRLQLSLLHPSSLISAAFVALLTLLLSTCYHNQQTTLSINTSIDHYGESIASLAAGHAALSNFAKDPISLQAVTRTIAEKKAVITVVAYDIDNNILAQTSIYDKDTHHHLQHYTAPVTISDGVAGSITISIDPQQLSRPVNHTILWLLAFLLMSFIAILYSKSKGQLPQGANTLYNHTMTDILKEETDKSEDTVSPTKIASENAIAFTLIIKLNNVDTVYQQLNADARKQQVENIQKIIKQVSSLYGGSIVTITTDSIIVGFKQHTLESVFNALCSGYLIGKINQQQEKSIFKISTLIQATFNNGQLIDSLQQCQQCLISPSQPHQTIIEQTLIDEFALNDRAIFAHQTQIAHTATITKFKGSYATLIDNQLNNLVALNPLKKS